MPSASHHAIEGEVRPVPGARYAIIASRWNPRITDALVEGARAALLSNGVPEAQLDILRVPGALELPVTAQVLARGGRHAAIVALGCVVRGETRHYEHVADETARGLMQVSLEHALPVANGVLAVEKHADAEARAGGVHGNKGEEAALAALEMAWLLHKLGPSLSMPVRLPAREASR
jgi:6,7-dimethyl-8-ribityllumazine synthase